MKEAVFFIQENWIIILPILLGFVEVVVRITPSERDNNVFKIIKDVFKLIPNNKKGGGKHL